MTIILKKGSNINLEKEAPNVTKFTLGLGWDTNKENGAQFDLDASALILDENEKILDGNDANVIFYGNRAKSDPAQSLIHTGDNLTGEGEGDDEQITIDFSKVPANAQIIKIIIDIYEAVSRGQNFGQVNNAYARVFKTETEEEVCKYDLTEDHSGATAIHIANFYRHNGEWKFKAVGNSSEKTLGDFIKEAGANVG